MALLDALGSIPENYPEREMLIDILWNTAKGIKHQDFIKNNENLFINLTNICAVTRLGSNPHHNGSVQVLYERIRS